MIEIRVVLSGVHCCMSNSTVTDIIYENTKNRSFWNKYFQRKRDLGKWSDIFSDLIHLSKLADIIFSVARIDNGFYYEYRFDKGLYSKKWSAIGELNEGEGEMLDPQVFYKELE